MGLGWMGAWPEGKGAVRGGRGLQEGEMEVFIRRNYGKRGEESVAEALAFSEWGLEKRRDVPGIPKGWGPRGEERRDGVVVEGARE